MREPRRGQRGFTLVELLIAAFILVILLSLVGAYLGQQATVSKRTQARSEVQDKVRMVSQIVGQDLQLAGASVYADDQGNVKVTTPSFTDCPTASTYTTCLVANDSNLADNLGMHYITSLRPVTEACRTVKYRVTSEGNLERGDSVCDDPSTVPPDPTDPAGYATLATNVLAFNVVYKCSNGNILAEFPPSDASHCPENTSFLRSAVLSVVAESDVTADETPVQTFDVVVVGPSSGTSAATTTATQSVECPPGAFCLGLVKEFLLPNMKDR